MSAEEKAGPEQSVPAEAIDWQEAVALKLSDLEPERAASLLLEYAATLPASDVFLSSDEKAVRVAVRYLGFPKVVASLPRDDGRHLMNHIKAVAGMDVSQRLRPEDGRWVFMRSPAATSWTCGSTASPRLYGEDMAIRLLDREMRAVASWTFSAWAARTSPSSAPCSPAPSGLILVTGPTGSGKTTTLYACLQHLNDGTRKINTIEDPIEYALDGVRQSQVNLAHGLGLSRVAAERAAPGPRRDHDRRDPRPDHGGNRRARGQQRAPRVRHAPRARRPRRPSTACWPWACTRTSSPPACWGSLAQRLVRTLCPKCKLGVRHQRVAADLRRRAQMAGAGPGPGHLLGPRLRRCAVRRATRAAPASSRCSASPRRSAA